MAISRLANNKIGLGLHPTRQLYQTCLTTVSDYHVKVEWKGQKTQIEPLAKIQNQVIRKMEGDCNNSPGSGTSNSPSLDLTRCPTEEVRDKDNNIATKPPNAESPLKLLSRGGGEPAIDIHNWTTWPQQNLIKENRLERV